VTNLIKTCTSNPSSTIRSSSCTPIVIWKKKKISMDQRR